MGKQDDPMTVVDSTLKVVGSNGRLRVADTSIFPTDMRGHPMAAAMAVGMRAAALIAEDYTAMTADVEESEVEVPMEIEEIDGDGEEMAGEGEDEGATSATSKIGGGECAFAVAATAATTCAFALTG